MNLVETVRLAARGLTRNRRRSLLSGLTIAVGVAAILSCKAYVDGLERLILEFVIDAREGALQVQREGYGAAREMAPLALDLPERGPIATRIAATPGVRAVAPRLRFVGMISNGEAQVVAAAMGVVPAAEAEVCPRGPSARPLRGAGLTGDEADEVVLGEGLARALDLELGDPVTLLVQTRGGSFDTADVVVRGTYRFPDPFEDRHLAVVPLAVAQRLVHMPGRVTSFAVSTGRHEGAAIDAVAAGVGRALAASEPRVEVHPWHEVSPYFRDVIAMQGQLMAVVVLVIFALVVASIVNTMLMSVLERTREIGTLMALGFRRRRILALVLVESVLLTAAASAVGVALGAGLVALAARTGVAFELPGAGVLRVFPRFAAGYVGWSLAAAAIAGLVGGLAPARRAARMRPIDALRA